MISKKPNKTLCFLMNFEGQITKKGPKMKQKKNRKMMQKYSEQVRRSTKNERKRRG